LRDGFTKKAVKEDVFSKLCVEVLTGYKLCAATCYWYGKRPLAVEDDCVIIIIIIIIIQRIWNLKCTIIPIIIGATVIVTRNLRKNLEAVPGKYSIDSLQKTAILGTSHIIRKVLQFEA